MRHFISLLSLSLALACSSSGSGPDSGQAGRDASAIDASAIDASAIDASAIDAASSADANVERTTLLAQFCPATATAGGLYRGSLASNLNDIAGASGCGTLSAPGRDGAVRIELAPGETVSATYRHQGDGVLYILDSCPVTSSCLDGSDSSLSGAEQVSFTNSTGTLNPVYVVLDSDSLAGDQGFELDLFITTP